jgi:hypothetical protein
MGTKSASIVKGWATQVADFATGLATGYGRQPPSQHWSLKKKLKDSRQK